MLQLTIKDISGNKQLLLQRGKTGSLMRVLTSRGRASESVLSEVNLWRGGVSTPLTSIGALLSFDFSCHSLLAYPASVWLAEGESSFFLYRLPVYHIFLKCDEMRLTAGFYCGALHIFTTKSYKSKAVTTYDYRLLFISYYILGLLDFKQTSNIFNINYM